MLKHYCHCTFYLEHNYIIGIQCIYHKTNPDCVAIQFTFLHLFTEADRLPICVSVIKNWNTLFLSHNMSSLNCAYVMWRISQCHLWSANCIYRLFYLFFELH